MSGFLAFERNTAQVILNQRSAERPWQSVRFTMRGMSHLSSLKAKHERHADVLQLQKYSETTQIRSDLDYSPYLLQAAHRERDHRQNTGKYGERQEDAEARSVKQDRDRYQ